MAGRTVTYIFKGDSSDLIASMAAAGAAAEALDAKLDSVGKHTTTLTRRNNALGKSYSKITPEIRDIAKGSTDVDRGMLKVERSVTRVGRATQNNKSNLNSFAGRLKTIGTAAALIGPALIPMGAALVPTIAGLVGGLGSLAGGAGVTMLAFKGMGDAFAAFNQAQAEPTAENIAKMREEMAKVGPAAESLIQQVGSMVPKFQALQLVAREGMFPGFEEGLRDIERTLPKVATIVSGLSVAMGTLGSDLGSNLADSADMQEFFDYLARQAGPTLEQFGSSLGNFVAGFANMIEAFDPITQKWLSGMQETSEGFRQWAADLENTQGFQEFMDYLARMGPKVSDFFSSLGSAIGNFVVAAAPIGELSLEGLTAVFEGISKFAGSDLGGTLIKVAAGMLALKTAMAGIGKLDRGLGSLFGMGASKAAMDAAANAKQALPPPSLFDGVKKGFSSARDGVAMYGMALDDAKKKGLSGYRALNYGAREMGWSAKAAGEQVGKAMKGMAKWGPGIAGTALALTGLDEKLGLQNASMGAMIGMMAGPWGAAIGGGIGGLMDLAKHSTASTQAFDALSTSMADTAQGALTRLQEMGTASEGYEQRFGSGLDSMEGRAKSFFLQVGDSITGNADKWSHGGDQVQEYARKGQLLQSSLQNLASGMGLLDASMLKSYKVGKLPAEQMEKIGEAMARAQPAMDSLGLRWEQFAGREQEVFAELDRLDSASGRVDTLAKAMAELGTAGTTAADGAQAIGTAFEQMTGPGIGLVGAKDQLAAMNQGMDQALHKQRGHLLAQNEAGRQNRAVIAQQVQGIGQLLTAQANAGRSGQVLAGTLRDQRAALMESATAAGLNRQQVNKLLDTYGLTPEAVNTMFEAQGLDARISESKSYGKALDGLPKQVRTAVEAPGFEATTAGIAELKNKYDLTPKQVKTIIEATGADTTVGKVDKLNKKVAGLVGKKAQIVLDAADNASPKAEKADRAVSKLVGKNARAILDAIDNASPKAQKADRAVSKLVGKNARAVLDAADNASPKAQKAGAAVDKVDGKKAQATFDVIGVAAAITMAGAAGAAIERVGKKKAKATVTLNDQVTPKANKASSALNKIRGKNARATASLNDNLTPRANRAANALNKIRGKNARATATLNDQVSSKANKANSALRRLGSQTAKPTATLQDKASSKIQQVVGKLRALSGMSAQPTVTANVGPALAGISAVIGALAAIPSSKTVTVNVVKRGGAAEGAIFEGGVQTFASGGFGGADRANRHWPELAKGTMRVWAEPETKGEAYIPLANDYRRPRAKEILEITASQFGGSVQWYAQGASDAARRTQTSRPQPQPSRGSEEKRGSKRRKEPMQLSGSMQIQNWADGTAYFEGVAQDVVDSNDLMLAENDRANW